eukprot:sb/3476360/
MSASDAVGMTDVKLGILLQEVFRYFVSTVSSSVSPSQTSICWTRWANESVKSSCPSRQVKESKKLLEAISGTGSDKSSILDDCVKEMWLENSQRLDEIEKAQNETLKLLEEALNKRVK